MFRGRPIDLSPTKLDVKVEHLSPTKLDVKVDECVTPSVKISIPVHKPNDFVPSSAKHSDKKTSSPVSIYEDEDYLVKDRNDIYPFGQQSIQARVSDLQAAAATSLPEVSSLPKILKSHNVGYKEGDNAAAWYGRFNNFCLMIGIYLPPPNSMQKNSEMGREWDSQSLPFVFYSRFAKMEKLLSHILFTPAVFFPKTMMDELQLNPKPYNFLRLFMALHSHSVPDLSDRVIKRPGPMKNGQTLPQYALTWVHYFDDEANVNGIVYSKFCQYCYFVDGISVKYSVVKKFLEMEFTTSHDRKDNIPISLELRNLLSTIVSICHVHGISVSHATPTNVHQLKDSDTIDVKEDCCDASQTTDTSIHKVNASSSKKPHDALPKSLNQLPSTSPKGTTVQCWLCDGPHSFRQCQELARVKGVWPQRPQVRKHFRQLLLQRNPGNELKVLLDAPEFFDDKESPQDNNSLGDNMPTDDDTNNVNSLQILDSEMFTTFNDGHRSSNVAQFPNSSPSMNRQLLCDDDDSDDASDPHFYILALEDLDPDVSNQVSNVESSVSFPSAQVDDFFISPSPSLLSVDQLEDCCDHIHSVSFDVPTCSQVKFHRFTTQVDGGADCCTTPHRNLVDNPPDPRRGEPLFIYDAGKHKHTVEGVGNF
jgi:hypothetical protein